MRKTEPVKQQEGLDYWCKSGAADLGINLDEKKIERLSYYYQMILQKNEEFNLTTILETKDVAIKHFIDSLTCLLIDPLEGSPRVIDIGAGAGLPGIPVKIARPQINLFLLDSATKKVNFLQEVIKELYLDNAWAFHGRAEDFAHQGTWREQFDYALCRALAPLSVVIEYCLAFLKKRGLLIAFKGPAAEKEIDNCRNALNIMGGVIREVRKLVLPFTGHERSLIIIEKVCPAPPQYPRRPGIPQKRPL